MTILYNKPKPERGKGRTFLLILALLAVAGLVYYFVLKEDDPTEADLTPDATADYDVGIGLEGGILDVAAEIEVFNDSTDSWDEIGFNFVPNGWHEQGVVMFNNKSMETRLSSVTDSEGDLF